MLFRKRRQDRSIGIVVEILECWVVGYIDDICTVGDEIRDLILDAMADEYGGEFGFLFVGELPALTEELQGHAGDPPFVLLCENPYSLIGRYDRRQPSLIRRFFRLL